MFCNVSLLYFSDPGVFMQPILPVKLRAGFSVAIFLFLAGVVGAQECAVGVNVTSFQNFSADQQMQIVAQLKQNHVSYVRTALSSDDKNMKLARTLQSEGIGLVLRIGFKTDPNVPARPEYPKPHIQKAYPLSAIDPDLTRAYFQTVFDKLDAYGVTVNALEVGNEINWVDFNGDFPMPGNGKALSLSDLSNSLEGKKVSGGLLKYLQILAILKEVRNHSKLNAHTPIITAGMAAVTGGKWQTDNKKDGVGIPVVYAFLRSHGLDDLVDGYGVHDYPPQVKGDEKKALKDLHQYLDEKIFPSDSGKPYWLTEWGYGSDGSATEESQREHSVEAVREYLNGLCREGRVKGIFWYTWNAPDNDSIYRDGALLPSGKQVIAPLH
jgi:Glycosyl hydrolase catalytic core